MMTSDDDVAAVLKRKTIGAVSLEQQRIRNTQRRLYIIVITIVKCLSSLM